MSAPDWKLQSQFNTALIKTTASLGTFLEDTGNGWARVNVFDTTITARYATRFRPRKGEGVILTFFGNRVRITGPTEAKNKLGTVTVVGHPYLTVLVDTRTYTRMPYTVSYENSGPKVGDTVSIDWDAGYVIDAVTATPDDSTDTPKLTTDQKPFELNIFARDSGSYRTAAGRWDSRDLYTDSAHQAAWFYGNTIKDQLRDDAYISSVEVFLSLRTRDPKGVKPEIGRHSDGARRAAGVSLYDGAFRGWTGWVRLPVAWAEDWRANVGGLSIGGGSSIYRGIGADRQSGKLRIRGRQ